MISEKTNFFNRRTSIANALRLFINKLKKIPPEFEIIDLKDGLNRVLAEDIISRVNVPNFSRSAMDGYAVRAQDTFGASETSPIILKLIGEVEIGIIPKIKVGKMEAVRITTGAPIPKGSDSVVKLEHARYINKGFIEIFRGLTPRQNVSTKGEDVTNGEKVLKSGIILEAQDLGILASIGFTYIKVIRKIKVAILSTGNELLNSGDKIVLGKTVDVNRVILASLIKEQKAELIDLGIVEDKIESICIKIKHGLKDANLILISGGTSVGSKDLVPKSIHSLGKPGILIHGVAMKPGAPISLAILEDKPIVLLPGSPVACMICFNVFVIPILYYMLGIHIDKKGTNKIIAKLTRRVASKIGMTVFLRVKLTFRDGIYYAEPIRTSGASIISTMVKADGLIVIPDKKEGVEEGEKVEVNLLRPLRIEKK
jgi:molybdenum cofactor synthesis domain-containing protein